MNNLTVEKTTSLGLCTGCGVCENVCKSNAITMCLNNGYYIPIVDDKKCTSCGLCLKICGGYGVDLKTRPDFIKDQTDTKYDYYAGYYYSKYTGYSLNQNIRYHSSSGGILTQFLIYLLENKIISGAIVTGNKEHDPSKPKVFLAKTKEQLLQSRGSKYYPVNFSGIINLLKNEEGKFIIVGLPCHIHSLRLFEKINSSFKQKIFGYFSIYCSGIKSSFSQDFLFRKYKINREKLEYFSYRDDGCLGYMKAIEKKGKIVKVPYKDYYLSLRSFFSPTRCSMCMDHYGELADVSFGDIHTGKYIKDTIGISSLIVRNKFFDVLLNDAIKDGFIQLFDVNIETINKSQQYVKIHKKGSGVKIVYSIRKLFKLATPTFNIENKASITLKGGVRYYIHWISRRIGKMKCFWSLIIWLDKIAVLLNLGVNRKE